jgi:LPS sulfotransferase NodH
MRKFPISYQPSLHETRLIEYFGNAGLRFLKPSAPQDLRTFVVCFTNRCGSNLLSELISTNTSFGRAGEYLNSAGVINTCTHKKFARLQQYLGWLARSKASPQGILGIKLDYRQLFFLTRTGLIPHAFGTVRFIHIQRADVLAQAVSHVIAAQNKAWSSKHKSELSEQDIVFREREIVAVMSRIHEANARFRGFFDLFGIKPVDVTYEELVRRPQEVGERVLQELGFEGIVNYSVVPTAITLTKQANHVNKSFIERIREHYDNFQALQ